MPKAGRPTGQATGSPRPTSSARWERARSLLAYLFWHRPAAAVDRVEYEEAQRRFHTAIGVPSGCFRLDELPFAADDGGDGIAFYEDWYLVDDWTALGELNTAAVDAGRRPSHDRAAALVGAGWAGVYRLLGGEAAVPEELSWLQKRPGEPVEDALAEFGDAPAWQRQMVLGLAPELCVAVPGVNRARVC